MLGFLLLACVVHSSAAARPRYAFIDYGESRVIGVLASFAPEFNDLTSLVVDVGLGCDSIPPVADGHMALAQRGNCTFENKTLAVQAAGAVALLVVNTDEMPFEMSGTGHAVEIISVMIGSEDGARLRNAGLPIEAKITMYHRNFMDFAIILMALLATAVVMLGAYWAAADDRARSSASLLPRPVTDATVLGEKAAYGFVFVASAGLILLFFFVDYLIYVVIFIFCLGGTQGLQSCFVGLVEWLYPSSMCLHYDVRLPLFGHVKLLELLMFVPAVTIAAVWASHRRADWAWVLQDIMGIALLLVMQHALRLPNIKVASILLCLAFLYDIFWVFLSPLFFTSSVMITVATGGDSGEALPVLLRLPSLNDPLGNFTMLGLGDIALPGLFISYLLRFDYRMSLHGTKSYFLLSSAGYLVGLLITDLVLALSESGQPALLYLVPCTVGLVVVVAKRRGHLKDMWTTPNSGRPEEGLGGAEDSCPP